VTLGRVIQGAGAISAAVTALLADLTREEHRTKAMAMIGASIGVSFAPSLAAGPVLNHWIGVPGIFWLPAPLALTGTALLYLAVPNPVRHRPHHDTGAAAGFFAPVLRDPQLPRLDACRDHRPALHPHPQPWSRCRSPCATTPASTPRVTATPARPSCSPRWR